MVTPIISTAADAWRHLVTTAGLDPDGYDEPLAIALTDGEGLGLRAGRNIADELERLGITIEDFLAAFFRAMRPYGEMLRDLLDLFTEAGAQFGEHNLAVEFDFGKGNDLGFDVEQFRQWLAWWRRASESFQETRWSQEGLWNLVRLLRRGEPSHSGSPEFRQWRSEYREQRCWPTTHVSLPSSGDAELDELLRRAWRLWETVMRHCAEKSRDRDDLAQQWRVGWNREDRESTEDDNWPIDVLGALDSDLWPASLLEGILSTSQQVRVAQGGDLPLPELKAQLHELFASVPAASVQREALVLEWQAYLDLPLWKRRHELYSAWVSTQILGATLPAPRRIHSDDGVLRFAFSGSHVASLPTFDPAVHLFAELRSPLAQRPVGFGRKARIQPDYTLLADPITSKQSAFLVVECKQYKRASRKNFLAALIDYAAGRPNAEVVLVNYGAVQVKWLDETPSEVRKRLHLIGDFRPGSEGSIDRFREIIRAVLEERDSSGQTTPSVSMLSMLPESSDPALRRVTLKWDIGGDLDLHLSFHGRDWQEVYFSRRGSLNESPWMELDADVRSGPGREEVQIARAMPGEYRCLVHDYSGDGFERYGASVELQLDGSNVSVSCPGSKPGRWWHIFDWNSVSGRFLLVNEVTDSKPTPGQ
jgi:hypothetical protein